MTIRIASAIFPVACLALANLAVAQTEGVGAIELDAKQIEVSGTGHQRSFPCNGRKVVVEGSNHVITLTGECASLEVSGAHNSVTVNLAPQSTLDVSGASHTVVWSSKGEPKQDVSGAGHKISRAANPR